MTGGTQELFPVERSVRAPASRRAVLTRPVITESTRERFWSRVVKTDTCWLWTGAISSPDGYGRMAIHHDGRQRSVATHRLALWMADAELGTEFVAEHHCNEPLCVRVDHAHVHVSNQSDNLRYAVQCGRASGPRPTVNSAQRVARSRAVRDVARTGFTRERYDAVLRRFAAQTQQVEQLSLFDLTGEL